MFDREKRIQELEAKVAHLETLVNLLLGHERLEPQEVPEVYVPARTVLVLKKR